MQWIEKNLLPFACTFPIVDNENAQKLANGLNDALHLQWLLLMITTMTE